MSLAAVTTTTATPLLFELGPTLARFGPTITGPIHPGRTDKRASRRLVVCTHRTSEVFTVPRVCHLQAAVRLNMSAPAHTRQSNLAVQADHDEARAPPLCACAPQSRPSHNPLARTSSLTDTRQAATIDASATREDLLAVTLRIVLTRTSHTLCATHSVLPKMKTRVASESLLPFDSPAPLARGGREPDPSDRDSAPGFRKNTANINIHNAWNTMLRAKTLLLVPLLLMSLRPSGPQLQWFTRVGLNLIQPTSRDWKADGSSYHPR
jgi:hypothetical protein